VRLLKLEESERRRFDVSSLKVAIHAAAPCAIPVKEAMIEWWGPILHEYYGGSEGIGMTAISCEEWRRRPGSVGKAILGEIHICDDSGAPQPSNRDGVVYFSGGGDFEYHNDPQKTAESHNPLGWATMGDIGHLDEEGYLYLTDRKSFMFISGGVNIYPQEIENELIDHPAVADVAVIGAPDDEMGERAVAVVQPVKWEDAGPELAAELIAFVRSRISHVKAPRHVDFMKELPRHENGKLYKRLLRDSYWSRDPR
jgi:acyl-coenzyme A synthetase/AMP-(fatty) acid ligase